MLAIATIGFGVHLVSVIFSGSLVCLVTDIETNPPNAEIPVWISSQGPMLPAYAAQNSDCQDQVEKASFI